MGHWLFPHLSSNNDEPIYVLQAETFRHGHVTLSAAAHDESFRPWMSGEHDGHLFLVVQPVLPALLAASDLLFGTMRIALGLIAAGAVIATFTAVRALFENERLALLAAAFFALSPFVIVQSALFLTYVLAVLLTGIVITLVSRGLKTGSRGAFAGAGLVYGVLLVARPIEGIMLALALVVWVIARRDPVSQVVRGAVVMVVGTLPIAVLMLGYNRVTTGNPFRFPLWAIGGNDSFGFGDRSIVSGAPTVHYGLSEAWLTLRTNLRAFPHWMLGGLITVPLGAWGVIRSWRMHRTATVFLLAIAVIYPLGYFFYWGNYLIIAGRNFFGPHYYMGLLLPATAFFAVAVDDLVRRRPPLAVALIPLAIAGTAIELGHKIDLNEHYRDFVQGEIDAVNAGVHEPAIVLLPEGPDGAYILHPRGAFANPPDLDSSRLFAADLLGRNIEFFDRYAGRALYRLQEVRGERGTRPDVQQLTYRLGDPTFDIDATSQPGDDVVAVYAAADRQFFVPCIVARHPASGTTFHTTVRIMPAGVTISGCEGGDVTAPIPTGNAALALGVSGTTGSDPASGDLVEQRYWLQSARGAIFFLTPADTWRRQQPDDAFVVVDPATQSRARFELTAF